MNFRFSDFWTDIFLIWFIRYSVIPRQIHSLLAPIVEKFSNRPIQTTPIGTTPSEPQSKLSVNKKGKKSQPKSQNNEKPV